MQLFYSENIEGNQIILDKEESNHAVRVLRKVEGDTINVIDGKGTLFSATIVVANPKKCVVEVFSKISDYGSRPYKLHIAIAPTKNIDRFEWFLEKTTEIGCDRYTPILCDHSERKVIKDEREQKVIMSAVKQSLKAFHPKFDQLTSFKDFIKSDFGNAKCFICHCEESEGKKLLRDLVSPHEDVVVLVGPEGDFSKEEVDAALAAGFAPVSLGESRLRVETAGVFIASLLNIINQ